MSICTKYDVWCTSFCDFFQIAEIKVTKIRTPNIVLCTSNIQFTYDLKYAASTLFYSFQSSKPPPQQNNLHGHTHSHRQI